MKLDNNLASGTTGPDDGLLQQLINVASEQIGRFCSRSNLGAVGSYTENYFKRWSSGMLGGSGEFNLVLRHYPIVTLTSVNMNGSLVPILNNQTLIAAQAGVFPLEGEEPRVLKFRTLWRDTSVPIQVVYTAGYALNSIPAGLRQAANAYCAEIYKSTSWVGYRSKSLAGEVVSFELGESWGMSKRVQALCKPHVNDVPFMGM